jgi:hypothetical protein
MRDPGASPKPLQRRADDYASPAWSTEPASPPGPGGPGSDPDAQGKPAGREGPHGRYDGEKRADRRAWSTAEDPAGNGGEHQERQDGKRGSDAKAAETIAHARGGSETESCVDASRSKRALYQEAKDAGIDGRSAMTKEELVEALRKHRATSSRREPATPQVLRPGRRPRTGRQSRSKGQPPLSEINSAEIVGPAPDSGRPEQCAIVYKGSRRHGEFDVVVTEADGSRRSVARSPAFRTPRLGALRRQGAARVAHELVVRRLEVWGWLPVDSRGAWHELRCVRLCAARLGTARSLVTVVREAGQARFVADELDTYGNPNPLALSVPFGAPRFLRIRPSRHARGALKQLIRHMESEGWKVAGPVGKDWYAISLWRRVSMS